MEFSDNLLNAFFAMEAGNKVFTILFIAFIVIFVWVQFAFSDNTLFRSWAKSMEDTLSEFKESRNFVDFSVSHHLVDSAINLLQSAPPQHQSRKYYNIVLGMLLLKKHSYSEALPYLETAMGSFDSASDNAIALHHLGFCLCKLGNLKDGVVNLKKSIEIDPQNVEAYTTLSAIYIATSKMDSAIALLKTATSCAPNSSAAWCALGVAYAHGEKFKDAIGCLEKSVALDKYNALAFAHIASIRFEHNEFGSWRDAIYSAQNKSPIDGDAVALCGEIWLLAGRTDDAIKAFNSAIESNPYAASYYNRLGFAYYLSANENFGTHNLLNKAVAAYRKAVEIAPMDSAYRFNLGGTLGTVGEMESAIVQLKKAIELDPNNRDASEMLERFQGLQSFS